MQEKDALRIKLEEFIRKYYKNQLIKGLIYGIGLSLSYLFILTLLEWVGRFPSGTRLVLLVLLVAGLLAIIGYYILVPLGRLAGIGRRLSYDRAAKIVGKHFPEIDDKITNTLQLQQNAQGQNELVQASIQQRIESLRPFSFSKVIDLGENRKYWPIVAVPLLVFIGVLVSGFWNDFRESGERIAAYNREFIPKAPFEFILENEDLVVEQGDDLRLRLGFAGKSLPGDASIILPQGQSRMTRNSEQEGFEFVFENLQNSFTFYLSAAGYKNGPYHVEVLPVPRVKALTLQVEPPAYTRIKAFETEAKMVMDVPEGSKVSWNLNLQNASSGVLMLDTADVLFRERDKERYTLEMWVTGDLNYSVKTANELLEKTSISNHKLGVIKDEYPEITNRYDRDSTDDMLVFISGNISDDYGFSRLDLVIAEGDKQHRKRLSVNRSVLNQGFGELVELDSFARKETTELRLFMEVFDNDAVNGAKRARSQAYTVKLLGREARKEKLEEKYQEFFGSKKQLSKEQSAIEEELKELQRKMMESKSLDWRQKEKIKELLRKQQELLKKQQENNEMLEKLQREEEQLMDKNEEIKQREEQIQEINKDQKELEELMEDIEKLMKDLNMEKLREKLEKMEDKNRQNRQANDRQEKLLEDLKFQKDVLEQAQKLEELAEEMEKLARDELDEDGREKDEDKMNQKESGEQQDEKDSFEEERKKQDEVKKEFEKAMEKLKELQDKDQSFKKATEDQKMDEQEQGVQEEMQKADDNLQQQQQQPANQNQQKSGEKMQEMSESMQMSMMQMSAESVQANMKSLRQILENLEILSFGMEELAVKSRTVSKDDPVIKSLQYEQRKMKDGTKVIEDSLVALSEKVPELKQVVFDELGDIKSNLDRGIAHLQDLENDRAAVNQQYVMTAANNLALLLDESLRNMQQQMSQMMPSDQNCQKPGSGQPKPSMGMMRKMQQELGEKMDGMKQGQKEGEGKGKKSEGRSGKEIVEMLSRQEQLRHMLEEMQKDQKGKGGNGNLEQAIEEMKKLEEDLLDGRLSDNYKERLREIETRLLESEKAELEQKQDEKRESKSADDIKQLYREELKKYLEEKESEKESIERVPLNFRHYYKGETTKYLNGL